MNNCSTERNWGCRRGWSRFGTSKIFIVPTAKSGPPSPATSVNLRTFKFGHLVTTYNLARGPSINYVNTLEEVANYSVSFTVPTHINLRRFIKIWRFQGGGLLKILAIKASKSLKKWTFGPKKWRFIQILLYWWFNQEWSFICVDTVV